MNTAPPRRLAVSANAVPLEDGNDPDFNNTHGEKLFGCYVRIEGEAVAHGVAQRELPLWLHMVALEPRKTKLAGEAGTAYAKRLIGEGCGTVQGPAELDADGLVDAGMRKGDAKLLMGRVSQRCTPSGEGGSSKIAKVPWPAWPIIALGAGERPRAQTRCRWRRRMQSRHARVECRCRGCHERD